MNKVSDDEGTSYSEDAQGVTEGKNSTNYLATS